MEIKNYNAQQLNELIHSDAFKAMPNVPVSFHRGMAHVNNPHNHPDDILIQLAFEGGEMVGYLGAMPYTVYDKNNQPVECGWPTGMWVSPKMRGKGLMMQMLKSVLALWNNRVIITEFTPIGKMLYDKSGLFEDLQINQGLRCFMRINLHEVLPPKKSIFKKLQPLLKVADAVANIPVAIKLSLQQNKFANQATNWQLIDKVDTEVEAYIQQKQTHGFSKHGAEYLNWMKQYPWVLQGEETDDSKRYYFSGVDTRFETQFYKLVSNGKLTGFAHVTIRNNHLKVPHLYVNEAEEAATLIYRLMYQYKLNMLTVFHPQVVNYFKTHPTPFLYLRPVKRHYIITKQLKQIIGNQPYWNIQDGEGDAAFT